MHPFIIGKKFLKKVIIIIFEFSFNIEHLECVIEKISQYHHLKRSEMYQTTRRIIYFVHSLDSCTIECMKIEFNKYFERLAVLFSTSYHVENIVRVLGSTFFFIMWSSTIKMSVLCFNNRKEINIHLFQVHLQETIFSLKRIRLDSSITWRQSLVIVRVYSNTWCEKQTPEREHFRSWETIIHAWSICEQFYSMMKRLDICLWIDFLVWNQVSTHEPKTQRINMYDEIFRSSIASLHYK